MTVLFKFKKNKNVFLHFKHSYSINTILKFLPDIKINKLDIINQKTDKVSLLGDLKNFNKCFSKADLDIFLSHGTLRTDYFMNFVNKGCSRIFEKKFSTYHTFTSSWETFGLKNYRLGNKIKNPTESQFINLNKSIYTNDNNIILDLNDAFYLQFKNYYLNGRSSGLELNKVLLNKMYKYQECYNLIDINYKNSCIQAVNVLYLKNEYFFEVITYM